MSKRLRGFTIIELLVVILIIGILLAAASVNFANARIAGRDTRRISDIMLISTAIDQSAAINRGTYPVPAVGNAVSICANGLVTNESSNPNQIDLSTFVTRKIPTDPKPVLVNGNCLDYQSGYIYHRFSNSGSNVAITGKFHYVMEVGLERTKNVDESNLYDAKFFNANANPITSPRYQLYLTGKSCGASCF